VTNRWALRPLCTRVEIRGDVAGDVFVVASRLLGKALVTIVGLKNAAAKVFHLAESLSLEARALMGYPGRLLGIDAIS